MTALCLLDEECVHELQVRKTVTLGARVRTASSWRAVNGTLSKAKQINRRSRRSGGFVPGGPQLVAGVEFRRFIPLTMVVTLHKVASGFNR